MEPAATDEQQPDQGIYYQDTNQSSKLTINNLPDEVLLEIIDSFRQSVDPYDQKWKREHLWLDLAHVCGRWRAVVFASITRLDLGITVGPEKPGHIKSILSAHLLPIFLHYPNRYTSGWDWEDELTGLSGSALWRMRAVLKHHPDRVREITFEAELPSSINRFFKMTTDCAFPMLESLSLGFFSYDPKIPATFLRGPDHLSGNESANDLHRLRHLTVKCTSLTSIFDFLSSATALTSLTLLVNTPFGPTPETSLLACLQLMPCLLSLDLTLIARLMASDSESPTPDDIVPLACPEEIVIHSKLKRLHLTGDHTVVMAFIRWFRAPSLEHIKFHRPNPDHITLQDLPY